MGDTDIRAALLSIADADTGRLLDARLYDDLSGLGRLVAFAGDRELALRTVLAIVRGAARHGANSQIRSWGWFARPSPRIKRRLDFFARPSTRIQA